MSEISKRDELVILARLSEQAERYEDMMRDMRELAMLGESLSSEERNLFSVAYKNVVGARRSAWRVLVSIKQREEQRAENEPKEGAHDHTKRAQQAEEYINLISKEIEEICQEVVGLVDTYLLKESDDSEGHESQTFYLKMKGDYYRYVAEVQDCENNTANSDLAKEAYSKAYEICKANMDPAHPIRLGLALNYSVFFYEIKVKHDEACAIAKEAFHKAIQQMEDHPDEKKYKDSTLIMQLLRDNLSLWSASEEEDECEQQQMQA